MVAVGILARNLTCTWNSSQVPILPTDAVTACLEALPFNSEWRDGTVQTLQKILPNYVLADSITDTGPPANIQVNLRAELDRIGTTDFERDMDMQSELARLFASVHDAHTGYRKCGAYSGIAYTQPFDLQVGVDGRAQKVFLRGEAFPGLLDHLDAYREFDGYEVVSMDGVAPITAITHFGDKWIGLSQDQGTRFNTAIFLRYFTFRKVNVFDVPTADVEYVLRNTETSEMRKVSLPWTTVATEEEVDISVARCTENPSLSSTGLRGVTRAPAYRSDTGKEGSSTKINPTAWRNVLSADPLGLFLSTDNSTAVLKLSSFSPDNYTQHCLNVQEAFKILAESGTQNLVVDLLHNGGGYVCLGYNFLRLLVPSELLHAPPSIYEGTYNMPWTKEISLALHNSSDSRKALGLDQYIDAETGEHVAIEDSASFYDGGETYLRGHVSDARRTKKFYLDCDADDEPCDMSEPSIVFPKERILVLSDGFCGSTCATFMHRLQAGSYATVAGVGGIKYVPMSSSSFAGGFVGNLDDLNAVLLPEDQISAGPTNGGLRQFSWGEVYDYERKSTPAQYAWSHPDIRFDFWDFNGDLGPLYDMAREHFGTTNLV